jgi:peptide/nickel transport system ATP-binding protein
LLLTAEKINVYTNGIEKPLELLHDVNLSINKGEVIAIIGESGSGKTTLTRALTNLFPFQSNISVSGKVDFEGIELLSLHEKDKRAFRSGSIRYVFQESGQALNRTFRIRSQVKLLISTLANSSKEFEESCLQMFSESLAAMGIRDTAHVLHSYPHQLSIGMLQRVMIALSITGHPKLLIADEPTSAVDASLRYQIFDFLLTQNKSQKTALLFTTHDLRIARKYADRIVVLYAGRIVESATKEQFFSKPFHPYSKILLNASEVSEYTFDNTDLPSNRLTTTGESNNGCTFHPRCPLVQDNCKTAEPLLTTIEQRREVRCLYWK